MKYIFIISFIVLQVSITSVYSQCWKKIVSRVWEVNAIHLDGTLWLWGGLNKMNSTPKILDSSKTWIDLSCNEKIAAGLKADGSLWTWGIDEYGQMGDGNGSRYYPQQIATSFTWKKVSCGQEFMSAIRSDGTLWVWGRNNYGQLGTGTNRTNSSLPILVGTDNDWIEVYSGKYGTIAKKADNSLWFFGDCYNSEDSKPRKIGTSSDWLTASVGDAGAYLIKQNGTLWILRITGGTPGTLSQLGNSSNWKKADTGNHHSLLIKNDGTLWGVGANHVGQCGMNDYTTILEPVQIGTDTDWRDAVAGEIYSLGLKKDLSFWAWGNNNLAQFGNGENRNTIKPILSNDVWKSIVVSNSISNNHSLAIQENGTLWGWGPNNIGQLGDNSTITRPIPVQIGTDANWKQVTSGYRFSLGIKTDGTLWGWGDNNRGKIGLGQTIQSKQVPTQIGIDTDWAMIVAGSESALAIKTNGTLWAWGYNNYGQIGNGITSNDPVYTPIQIGTDNNWTGISAGERHSLALKSDSTLWSWGGNNNGQLIRSPINSNIPGQVGNNKWLNIAGGGFRSLLIKSDSTLWEYSGDANGQKGTANNWIQIESGFYHSFAIASDSTIWGWGKNVNGQLGDSSYYNSTSRNALGQVGTDHKWLSVCAGSSNTTGITSDGQIYNWGESYGYDAPFEYPLSGFVNSTPVKYSSCSYCETFSSFNQTICPGDSILYNDHYRLEAGNYPDSTINGTTGCYNIHTLNLTVRPTASRTEVRSSCGPYIWIDGITYTSSNNAATYVRPGVASGGCDSIIKLNLTVKSPTSGTSVHVACQLFKWIDGITYTSSTNSPTYTLTAKNGCDSVVTLSLTIKPVSTGTDFQTACGSYQWIDGNTYTTSNNSAQHTLVGGSVNGCDSIVKLQLTILPLGNSTDIHNVCDSYTWINGVTYTNSNTTATHVLSGAATNGCDSIIHLNLTIRKKTSSIANVNSCEAYTWIDGNTYATSTNTPTHVVTNAAGCDSTIKLNLVITPIDKTVSSTGVKLTANQQNATYQWIDCDANNAPIDGATARIYTATKNGRFAVVISKQTCTDTSDCITVSTVEIDDLNEISELKIYPNPSEGIISIEIPFSSLIEIEDATGRLVYSLQLKQGVTKIDLSKHPTGVYLIRSKNGEQEWMKRIVLSR